MSKGLIFTSSCVYPKPVVDAFTLCTNSYIKQEKSHPQVAFDPAEMRLI